MTTENKFAWTVLVLSKKLRWMMMWEKGNLLDSKWKVSNKIVNHSDPFGQRNDFTIILTS